MTLGNLGETFELIAIKAAGISLLRFMRPLFFVSLATHHPRLLLQQ
jgi:lipopolysaccharide export system permease protein